ncbi:MAG: peptidoglycan DD-metalloendopeptidase family protein [Bacteroidota bacterium]
MSSRQKPLRLLLLLTAFAILTGLYTQFLRPDKPLQQTATLPVTPEAEPEILLDEYGIEDGIYEVEEREVRRNETFAGILSEFGVPYDRVMQLVDASRGVFDVRRLRAGQELRVYNADDESPRYLVYREDAIRYVVFDLDEEPRAEAGTRPVEIVERSVEGVITNSLYQSLMSAGADAELAVRLAEVYAWTIDFYRIQKGDRFQVLFEERRIDGQTVGIEKIVAARFNHFGADHNAFYFEQDGFPEYFDEEGNSLRKAFLRAPLKYTRISSRYTQRRFHPVQKRYKPHLGTDYAAPTGTPIHTVGDGVITEASYTRGNGNYVKVRHNGTYTTQYLHMSRIAKGVRPGVRVKQGDVIGYVGATGLATGPHLCFRFWKNGKQVDPFKEQLPAAEPVSEENLAAFAQVRDQMLARFDGNDRPMYVTTGDDAASL